MRTSAAVRAYYSDRFVLPLPIGHRFPMSKYRRLRERCEAECPGLVLVEAQPATDGELALVHEPRYIDAVDRGLLSPAEQREIGFPWSDAMAQRARRSVGATIGAAASALFDGEGVAANLAGGTHHAYAGKGSGWCVFNDAAVAARLMQAQWLRGQPQGRTQGGPTPSGGSERSERGGAGPPQGRSQGGPAPSGGSERSERGGAGPRESLRVAVIDLDVHQGNGTAAIFRDDDSVFTLSVHGARNFPFRKEASDLDVELPDGCDDDGYVAALVRALAALRREHERAPFGLAFYLAGADPHERDRLGRLRVSFEGLAERDRRVFDLCRETGVPVAVSMAGGYGHDVDDTVGVHLTTLREAVRHRQMLHDQRQRV